MPKGLLLQTTGPFFLGFFYEPSPGRPSKEARPGTNLSLGWQISGPLPLNRSEDSTLFYADGLS